MRQPDTPFRCALRKKNKKTHAHDSFWKKTKKKTVSKREILWHGVPG